MIKNAQKARKIIGTNFLSRYWDGKSAETVYAIQREAYGYLAALEEGPEVRMLIDALQSIDKHQAFVGGRLSDLSTIRALAKRVLSKFAEAVKG